MVAFIKLTRAAFCTGLAGMVIPQLFYRQFQPNFFPAWPGLPWIPFWSYLFTAMIIVACAAIVFGKNGRMASLFLGAFLLAVYILGYIPYELWIEPHNGYLGSWAEGLKEPALAGGAFVMAGSFPAIGRSSSLMAGLFPRNRKLFFFEDRLFSKKDGNGQSSSTLRFLGKMIPFGPVFFFTDHDPYMPGSLIFCMRNAMAPLVPCLDSTRRQGILDRFSQGVAPDQFRHLRFSLGIKSGSFLPCHFRSQYYHRSSSFTFHLTN